MCEKCEEIKKKMLIWKDDLLEFMGQMIKDKCGEVLAEIENIPTKELPLKINAYPDGSPKQKLLKLRLQGEDFSIPNLIPILPELIPLLWDQEFDVEDYKSIGINDGEGYIVSMILRMLGCEEDARQISAVNYSD